MKACKFLSVITAHAFTHHCSNGTLNCSTESRFEESYFPVMWLDCQESENVKTQTWNENGTFNKKFLKQSFVLETAGMQTTFKNCFQKKYIQNIATAKFWLTLALSFITMRPVHRHGGWSSSKNFNMAQILTSNSLQPSNKTLRCPIK